MDYWETVYKYIVIGQRYSSKNLKVLAPSILHTYWVTDTKTLDDYDELFDHNAMMDTNQL